MPFSEPFLLLNCDDLSHSPDNRPTQANTAGNEQYLQWF